MGSVGGVEGVETWGGPEKKDLLSLVLRRGEDSGGSGQSGESGQSGQSGQR